MSSTENNQPDVLRQQLVELKSATLKVNAILMGLKHPHEDIAPAALAKIQADATALTAEELTAQIQKWTDLHRRATLALATRPTPPTGLK